MAAAAILVIGAAFWAVPSSLVLREHSVPLAAPALKGLRIAVIADLHAGSPYIGERKIDDVVAMTNAANPDLILLAGDYTADEVIGGSPIPNAAIARHLARLEAPLGVFAVLGNHDSWSDPDGIGTALEQAGIFVLRNFHVVLATKGGTVMLAGLGTREAGTSAVRGTFNRMPAGAPALCLTHSPTLFSDLPPTCALTISGHTHGGQVALPWVGAPILPSQLEQRYARGLVREGGKSLFVSTGIGTSRLPVRLGVTPEISLLEIQ